MKNTTVKSQVTSITQVLRSLGLKSGTDFEIEGLYDEGHRTGTGVFVVSDRAHGIIAGYKSRIETEASGFRVGVSHTLSGKVRTYVDNVQY